MKLTAPITILGIDPGTAHTGMAVLQIERGSPPRLLAAQTFHTDEQRRRRSSDLVMPLSDSSASHPYQPLIPLRINWLMAHLRAICQSHQPDFIAVEEFTYFNREISAQAHDCYRLLGAIYTLADYASLVCLQPAQWRRQLTGLHIPRKLLIDGRSIKTGFSQQVRCAVYLRLGLNGGHDLTFHEVDAAGVALVVGDQELMDERL